MTSFPSDSPNAFAQTAITATEPDLLYRGYRVDELTERMSFVETAYLLSMGELPNREQLADWQAMILGGLKLTDRWVAWLSRVVATAQPLDTLSAAYTRVRLKEGAGPLRLPVMSDGLPRWLGFTAAISAAHHRLNQGRQPLEPRDDLGFVGNLWWIHHGRSPTPMIEKALEALFIAGADHGLTPTTLAVRMAAAARADYLASLQTGILLTMSAHPVGQALSIEQLLNAGHAPDEIDEMVATYLSRKQNVPGFEHRIYRVGDPRTEMLSPWCERLSREAETRNYEPLAQAIEGAVWDRQQRLPNVIWPAVRLLSYTGFDFRHYGPLFVLSRMAGWTAHYVEQAQRDGPLTATTQYTGPAARQLPPAND